MAIETATNPIEDSIGKINDDVAVGEDLVFQRRWWRFERAVWIFFGFLVVLDVLGIFGRGPLSRAHKQTADGAMRLDYEWVERFSTPSILTLRFGPNAVADGVVRLWVSDSIIRELGNQRVIPQPNTSVTGDGGVVYTFPSTARPSSVEFALEPSKLGRTPFSVRLLGKGTVTAPEDSLEAKVFVMP